MSRFQTPANPRFRRPRALAASLLVVAACASDSGPAPGTQPDAGPAPDAADALPFDESDPALSATALSVRYVDSLDAIVFEIETAGDAASVVPTPAGQVDGAPVLGYVFPTTLDPADVGFGTVEGTVALAVTSHPDFDDTPLWDEDGNDAYDDDGVVYHAHWVVLHADDRAPAGLAVVQADETSTLPPTAPMPMYLDSPGFTVVEDGAFVRVVVPADRVRRQVGFDAGALIAYMEVDASGTTPLLAVHRVLSAVADGAASTAVANAASAPASAWPQPSDNPDSLVLTDAAGVYEPTLDSFVLSIDASALVATQVPVPAGQVDGAPVLGYVFATDIAPAVVGFGDIDGTLVLAVTTHPDFDDTPLWDEDLDRDFGNDGATYHVHWAVLVADDDSPAGLSVPSQADMSALPPTAPMPMYLDSPGYHAFAAANKLRVVVPGWHLAQVTAFSFSALTAEMRVDASGAGPVLRVERVVHSLADDRSVARD